MNTVLKFFIVLCAGVLLFSSANAGSPFGDIRFWNTKDMLAENGDSYQLKAVQPDQSHKVYGTISRQRLLLLTSIKDRLQKVANTSVDLFLTTGDKPNAFATPITGRFFVAINLPMLEMLGDDPDAIAALLGHEIAHLKLRHLEQQRQNQEQLKVARIILGGIVGGVLGSYQVVDPFVYQGAGSILDLLAAGSLFSYSRDQEREADHIGVDYLHSAGFNPQGAVRLWQDMVVKHGGGKFALFNTHPTSIERVTTLSERVAQSYPDWADKKIERTPVEVREATDSPKGTVEVVALESPVVSDRVERSTALQTATMCRLESGEKTKLPRVQCIRQGGKIVQSTEGN